MNVYIDSNVTRFCLGLAAVSGLVAVGSTALSRYGLTGQERFRHYLSFYMRRHADWCGVDDDPGSRLHRLLAAILADHSLFRLAFPAGWSPLPPAPFTRRLLVLLALVQTHGTVGMIFFVPPIRDAIPVASLPFAILAALACVLAHVLLRAAHERLHVQWTLALFRRLDEHGASEGHMLARAALAHFDTAHTLRDVLRSWQRVARQLGRIEATFARLACSNVLRGWWAACSAIEVQAAAQRLRVQKVHAWSLIKPSWLHTWCDDVGERLRPLGAQLRFAMPLHEGLIDALARSTHAKLEPSASERLLERPAVMRARLFLGARWALATWVASLHLMARELEARRAARTALGARRTAEAARRAAYVLGVAWGLRAWAEAVELLNSDEAALQSISAQMGPFVAGQGHAHAPSESTSDSDASDDAAEGAGTEDGGSGGFGRLARRGALAGAIGQQRGTRVCGGGASGRSSASSRSRRSGAGDTEEAPRANPASASACAFAWTGVSALEPYALLDDQSRLAAIRQHAIASHPEPPARAALQRPLTCALPHPVGETLLSVERVRCVQAGKPPPPYARAQMRIALRRGEVTPRGAHVEGRRAKLFSQLVRLAERVEVLTQRQLEESAAAAAAAQQSPMAAAGYVQPAALLLSEGDDADPLVASVRERLRGEVSWLYEERMRVLQLAELQPAAATCPKADPNIKLQQPPSSVQPRAVLLAIDTLLRHLDAAAQLMLVERPEALALQRRLHEAARARERVRQASMLAARREEEQRHQMRALDEDAPSDSFSFGRSFTRRASDSFSFGRSQSFSREPTMGSFVRRGHATGRSSADTTARPLYTCRTLRGAAGRNGRTSDAIVDDDSFSFSGSPLRAGTSAAARLGPDARGDRHERSAAARQAAAANALEFTEEEERSLERTSRTLDRSARLATLLKQRASIVDLIDQHAAAHAAAVAEVAAEAAAAAETAAAAAAAAAAAECGTRRYTWRSGTQRSGTQRSGTQRSAGLPTPGRASPQGGGPQGGGPQGAPSAPAAVSAEASRFSAYVPSSRGRLTSRRPISAIPSTRRSDDASSFSFGSSRPLSRSPGRSPLRTLSASQRSREGLARQVESHALTPEEAATEALRAKSRAESGLKRIDAALRKLLDRCGPESGEPKALRKLLDRQQPDGGKGAGKGAHRGAHKGVIPSPKDPLPVAGIAAAARLLAGAGSTSVLARLKGGAGAETAASAHLVCTEAPRVHFLESRCERRVRNEPPGVPHGIRRPAALSPASPEVASPSYHSWTLAGLVQADSLVDLAAAPAATAVVGGAAALAALAAPASPDSRGPAGSPSVPGPAKEVAARPPEFHLIGTRCVQRTLPPRNPADDQVHLRPQHNVALEARRRERLAGELLARSELEIPLHERQLYNRAGGDAPLPRPPVWVDSQVKLRKAFASEDPHEAMRARRKQRLAEAASHTAGRMTRAQRLSRYVHTAARRALELLVAAGAAIFRWLFDFFWSDGLDAIEARHAEREAAAVAKRGCATDRSFSRRTTAGGRSSFGRTVATASAVGSFHKRMVALGRAAHEESSVGRGGSSSVLSLTRLRLAMGVRSRMLRGGRRGSLSHARARLTSRAPSRLPHWLGRPGALRLDAAGAAAADYGVDMRLFGRDLSEHEPAVLEAMAELSFPQPPPARGACTRMTGAVASAALGGGVASTAADELKLAAEARLQARTNRSLGMELRELAAERRELRDEIVQRRRRSLALHAGGSPQLPRDPHSGSGSIARRLPVLGLSALSPAQASEETLATTLENLLDRLHTVDTRLQLVVVQIASQGARSRGRAHRSSHFPNTLLRSPNPPPKHPSPPPHSLPRPLALLPSRPTSFSHASQGDGQGPRARHIPHSIWALSTERPRQRPFQTRASLALCWAVIEIT